MLKHFCHSSPYIAMSGSEIRNTNCNKHEYVVWYLHRCLFNSHLKDVVHKIILYLTSVYKCLQNWAMSWCQLVCLFAKREKKKVFTVNVLVVINACDSACQLPHPIGHHAGTASCCGSRRGSSGGQPTLSDQNQTPPCQPVPGKLLIKLIRREMCQAKAKPFAVNLNASNWWRGAGVDQINPHFRVRTVSVKLLTGCLFLQQNWYTWERRWKCHILLRTFKPSQLLRLFPL